MNNYFNTINLFSLTMKCVLPEVAQKLEHWEHFKLHAAVSLSTRCWPSLYVKHSQEGNPQAPQQLTWWPDQFLFEFSLSHLKAQLAKLKALRI